MQEAPGRALLPGPMPVAVEWGGGFIVVDSVGDVSIRTPRLSCCSLRTEVGDAAAPLAAPPQQRKGFWTPERSALGLGFVCWLVVGLLGYTSGYVEPGPGGNGLTVEQSIYLMCQILTSVGYGDLTPKSNFGMTFTALHTLLSGLVVSALVSEAVDHFVKNQNAIVDKFVDTLCSDDDPTTESFLERNSNIIKAALYFLVSLAIWVLFFMYYCDGRWDDYDEETPCEGKSFTKAFYFAVVSLSTVGFGDVTPRTHGGKWFVICGVWFGISAYLNLVGAIADRIQSAKHNLHLQDINPEDLLAADASNDGEVDLYEFTRFILTRSEIVSADLFDRIAKNFQELDADCSGNLSMHDVAIHYSRRVHKEGHVKAQVPVSPGDVGVE